MKKYKVWWYWNRGLKIPVSIENTNINEILVFNKASFGKNNFK